MNTSIRNPWGLPQPQDHHDAPGIAARHPKMLGKLTKHLNLTNMGETVFLSLSPITQKLVIDFGLELLALDMADSLAIAERHHQRLADGAQELAGLNKKTNFNHLNFDSKVKVAKFGLLLLPILPSSSSSNNST
ncbi:hypothetical protein CSUB01_06931 [Colletotrichum sublineola]|uniref:Uncharacterized protein n=1 Tax=Colletotrichum sublineola TaxID=1173701 RepID=A0A066X6Q5_COLSU|nr:hypothetical protein CSUB01_06931 [Colletotrichum sublineola]